MARKVHEQNPSPVYVANTGLTWWGPEISARLYAGEQIPHHLRGEELTIESGEILPEEYVTSCSASLVWLLEQGLIQEVR